MHLSFISQSTPIGLFTMFLHDDVVVASGFGDVEAIRAILPSEYADTECSETTKHPYIEAVNAYFAGNLDAITLVNYEQSAGEFLTHVWQVMSEIKPGEPITYTELASRANAPLAIRAAASACAKNKVALFIPCHRIIKSDGTVGQFAYGSPIKKFLLEHEAKFS